MSCPERERLASEVQAALKKLAELTQKQLNAFHARDNSLFLRLDKELDVVVGEKERTIGAYRQHVSEHGC